MSEDDTQERKYQQWFDTALAKLREQGRLSIVMALGTRRCQYRSPDGCRCAIGWLIPDEAYVAANMEGKSASYVWEAIPNATRVDRYFLNYLQQGLHDSYLTEPAALPYHTWLEVKAAGFAAFHGLTYTPLEGESA